MPTRAKAPDLQAQHQLTAIMSAANDAIIGVTMDRVVVSWSYGAQKIYGYSAGEMVGHRVDLLMPPERIHEMEQVMGKLARGEAVEPYETTLLTKGRAPVQVEISMTPIADEHGLVSSGLVIARDITARKQAERTVAAMEIGAHNRAVVLEAANRVALDILSSRTGSEALRHIADAARVLASARYAALGVAGPDGRSLDQFITVGLTPEQEAAIGPRPKGAGVLGLLLSRTDPLRVDTLGEHPAAVGFPPNHPAMESFLGVPIRRGDVALGSLYLTNKQGGGAFTEADEVAVQALGAHAAVAIQNLHMLSRQRALVSGLMTAQEEERRAVAYDLHDGLTQYVMAAHAHLEAFKRAHEGGKAEKAASEMEQGLKYLKEAVVESRRLVNGLRSLALDDLGLSGALEQLLNEEKARCGWKDARLIHNIAERRFDKMLETGAYRVAQEALTNVRKHAQTTRLQVLLVFENEERQGERLRLQVRDWGRGFDPQHQNLGPSHVGLHGMAERVHLLGGTFAVVSAPGAGTTVTAIFPILATHLPDTG
jgi:PAS domain S-box-containing protein